MTTREDKAARQPGVRNGAAYIESLRDGREVWIDGERVADVTRDPRFRGAMLSLADLYEVQTRPDLADTMTFRPSGVEHACGASHMQPRSQDDLRKRRKMVQVWADRVGGMMGRTPDFLNILVAAMAANSETLAVGGEQFARNAERYHAFIRDNDCALTHSLVTPDVDKSKMLYEQPADVAMRVVKENDAGIFVTGARSVATLGPLASEILVLPSPTKFPTDEEAKPYAVGFATPAGVPGLKMICRPSLATAGRAADNPLSVRMDEMDAVLWFDNVFVPWERVFIHRNLKATARAGAHGAHQSSSRALAKAEFLLGIVLAMASSNNADKNPQTRVLISEVVNTVDMLRALIEFSETQCRPGPNGTVIPSDEPLSVVRGIFPQLNYRIIEILQMVGAGSLVVAPSIRELDGGMAAAVNVYANGVEIDARKRTELLRLAWDASCSSYAGRQSLYERFFSGDPLRNAAARTQNYQRANELKSRVWDFIARNPEWDERLAAEDGGFHH
jgi:4-hydroxyphenylacetate 3-monooxygenase oxygenase component